MIIVTNPTVASQKPYQINLFNLAKTSLLGYEVREKQARGSLIFKEEEDAHKLFPLLQRLGWINRSEALTTSQYDDPCDVVDHKEAIWPLINQLLIDHGLPA